MQVLLARRSLGLAPIYAALLLLVAASLLGFLVASWHSAAASYSCGTSSGEASLTRHPFDAGQEVVPDARKAPPGGTWM